jgi:hypothetical protein
VSVNKSRKVPATVDRKLKTFPLNITTKKEDGNKRSKQKQRSHWRLAAPAKKMAICWKFTNTIVSGNTGNNKWNIRPGKITITF